MGDIHAEPYFERLKFLVKIRNSKHIKKAETRIVDNEADLRKAVNYFARQEGSEGAYLKVLHGFPYELDGQTRENIKYKNTFSIDAKVVDIHEVKDANAFNYLCVLEDEKGNDIPIGRTYNTSIKVGKGDILKVEFVNLNKYLDPETKKAWFNWWSPHVIMAREDKKKPDNIITAEKLVEASHGTVSEKPWPKRYSDAFLDTDPYLTYPDQTKKWKGMVHCHGRGRSIHLDFRAQFSADFAIGWTLYIPKGFSKVPESYTEFKKLVDAEIIPLVKETMSNPMKKFNCGQKEPEPIEWLTYEGMVQPGQVGATKNEPGFFYIIDSFEVQFGCLKSYYCEYFCDGKIFNGRLIFRLLANREEWKKTDEGLMTWMTFNALKSPTPYVISARAVKKKWVPPAGASALPRRIRTKIPDKFHYWNVKDTTKRRALRDDLVDALKEKVLSLDAIVRGEFKFLKQTWKGQKVIREGPSKTLYYFVFKNAKDIWAVALNADITEQQSAAGLVFTKADALWDAEGLIAPGTKLNTTKNTPSNISVLDKGAASMLTETENGFTKFILKGNSLKGVWVAFQQEETKMWAFRKSEMPEPEK